MSLRKRLGWTGIGLVGLLGGFLLPGGIATSVSKNQHRLPGYENLSQYHDDRLVDVEVDGTKYQTIPGRDPARIVALSFGENTDNESSNYQIAKAVEAAQKQYGGLPIFAQKEVSQILTSLGIDNTELTPVGEMWRDYADTNEMLRRLKTLANGASGENVMVAHPAHMERAQYLSDYAGIETTPFTTSTMGFHSDDRQSWVTSQGYWLPLEVAKRAIDAHRL